jgi:hypothetical protein
MLIIDAYNVLNVQGVLPPHLAAPDLLDLVRLLTTSRYRTEPIILVCDGHLARHRTHAALAASGQPTALTFLGVRLIFSGPGQEADDVIESLLRHHQGSSSLVLVSSDKRLKRSARKWGARPLDSADFLFQLAHDHDRPTTPGQPAFTQQTPLSRADLTFWMRHFGLGDPVLHPAPPPPPPETPAAPPAPKPNAPTAQSRPPSDPTLLPLIRESGLSIDLAELDMNLWLDKIQPFPPSSSS